MLLRPNAVEASPVVTQGGWFGDNPELDDKVARQVFGLGFAALLAPKAGQGGFVIAHDDPRIRAADEVAAILSKGSSRRS